jgi:hypothetical protein
MEPNKGTITPGKKNTGRTPGEGQSPDAERHAVGHPFRSAVAQFAGMALGNRYMPDFAVGRRRVCLIGCSICLPPTQILKA